MEIQIHHGGTESAEVELNRITEEFAVWPKAAPAEKTGLIAVGPIDVSVSRP
jgi:hypothetical protein